MKKWGKRGLAVLLLVLIMVSSFPAYASYIRYDQETGVLTYESTEQLDQDSSLVMSVYEKNPQRLVNVSTTTVDANKPLRGALGGLHIKLEDLGNYMVKVFSLDGLSTMKPLSTPLYQGSLNSGQLPDTTVQELKDITNVTVYTKSGNAVVETAVLDSAHLENYLVRVDMVAMPSTYAMVKDYDKSTGAITLDLPNVVTRGEDGALMDKAVVDGPIPVTGLDELLAKVKADPTGSFVLTSDLDGSMFVTSQTNTSRGDYDAALMDTFKGTLDGNGHKILNMKVPLFLKTENATIKNLILEAPNLVSGNPAGKPGQTGRERNAPLTMIMLGGTVENVHVTGLYINTQHRGDLVRHAGLVAYASNGTIRNCSVTGFHLDTFWNRAGGLVAQMEGGSITDCYVQGKIGTLNNYYAVTQVGGLVGYAKDVQLNHNIANVTLPSAAEVNNLIGGFVGKSEGTTAGSGNLVMGDVITSGWKFVPPDDRFRYTNCYELTSAQGKSSVSDGIAAVEPALLFTRAFYETTLGLSSPTWNLDYMATMGLPAQGGIYPGDTQGNNVSGLYIPNYPSLRHHPLFQGEKKVLYHNLYKLMPFATGEQILAYGQLSGLEQTLNHKAITDVLFLEQGKYQPVVTVDRYQAIDGVMISYGDHTRDILSLSNPRISASGAPVYHIDAYGLDCTGNFYASNPAAPVVGRIAQAVAGKTYEGDLLTLKSVGGRDISAQAFSQGQGGNTSSDFNMLDETATAVLSDGTAFAQKLLSTRECGYNTNVNSPLLDWAVEQSIAPQLNSYLYAYIYYKNWYNIDFEKGYLPDVMFFHSGHYGQNFDLKATTNAVVSATRADRRSNVTSTFFVNRLAKPTGFANVGDFMDANIRTFTDETDPAAWFEGYFKGVSIYRNLDTFPNLDCRTYQALKATFGGMFLLPALTYNDPDLYLVSVPSQLIFGSLGSYGSNRQGTIGALNGQANNLQRLYSNSSKLIRNSEQILNNLHLLQVDTFLEPGGWVAPPHSNLTAKKYFYQAAKINIQNKTTLAYSNGTIISFVKGRFSEVFGLITHENAHSQDSKYYMEGYGRRGSGTAENYSDGIYSQPPIGLMTTLNFAGNSGPTSDWMVPLQAETINTNEKAQRYYQRYYEAMYTLDLLEAEAMLSLPVEVQRQLVFQHSKRASDATWTDKGTIWNQIPTVDAYKALDLKSYADFATNHLNITRDEKVGEYVPSLGAYKAPTFQGATLSTPYCTTGMSDWRTFKRFGYEMMAIKGYSDGFITYISSKSPNDLAALRSVTGDPTMTFERFDAEKHDAVAGKIDTSAYFDRAQCVKWFQEAYLRDVAGGKDSINAKPNSGQVRIDLMRQFSRQTNDFRDNGIYDSKNVVDVSTPQELVSALQSSSMKTVRLTCDLDFAGYTTGAGSYVAGTYVGVLDGNGHTIQNLTSPLFNNIMYTTVKNLRLEKVSIRGGDYVGGLSKTSNNSRMENVHMGADSTISGGSYVGGLVGADSNSMYGGISVNATIKTTGNNVGGMIGYSNRSTVANCYTTGIMNTSGANVGGLMGSIGASGIASSYSAMEMNVTGMGATGSLVGTVHSVSGTLVHNCFAVGGSAKARKLDGGTSQSTGNKAYSRCYEYTAALGASFADFLGDITFKGVNKATPQMLSEVTFFTDTLGFDPTIWSLDGVAAGQLPKLRSPLAENSVTAKVTEIASLEDLLNISKAPSGLYVLTADIDASGYTGTTPLIPAFGGSLVGGAHTISNLSQPLFGTLTGGVSDLTLKNATITQTGMVGNGALANILTNAGVTNLTLDTVAITGGQQTGGLVGSATSSVLRNISAKNVQVTYNGTKTGDAFVGGLIGRMVGGSLTNVYIQGGVQSSYGKNGGVLGAAEGGAAVGVVFARVDGTRTGTAAGTFGGFAGYLAGSTITNSIALGNMAGDPLPLKFVGDESYVGMTTNCYQAESATGGSNGAGIFTVLQNSLATPEFYQTSLNWSRNGWDFAPVTTGGDPILLFRSGGESPSGDYVIDSPLDFINVANDLTGAYVLGSNLDLSGLPMDFIVQGTFTGTLKGNGHTVTGLQQPLFEAISGGTVENLKLDKASFAFSTQDNLGLLTPTAENARFDDIFVSNSTFSGRGNIGGLVGVDSGSTFDTCVVNLTLTATGENAGHLIGAATSSNITNCFVSGQLTTEANNAGGLVGADSGSTFNMCLANLTLTTTGANAGLLIGTVTGSQVTNCYTLGQLTSSAACAGGLVGLATGATVSQSYSNAQVNQTSSTYPAGTLLGSVADGTTITSCMALGGGTNARQLDGSTDLNTVQLSYVNCKEYDGSNAASLAEALLTAGPEGTSGAPGVVDVITQEQIGTLELYQNLGFNTAAWNLDDVPMMKLPRLNNSLDTNNIQFGTATIKTLEGLLNISRDPAASYILGADIDLSSYTGTTPLISTFSGKLDGRGYTLSGGTQALFGTCSGTVKNVKLEDFALSASAIHQGTDKTFRAGAFALVLKGAVVSKIEMRNISLTGPELVTTAYGSLCATATNSTISEIHCSNVDVQVASGGYVAGLIGQMEGGRLNDAFVSGTIVLSVLWCPGGAVAQTELGATVTNVFAAVAVTDKAGAAGGFVSATKKSQLTGCITVGDVTGGGVFMDPHPTSSGGTYAKCYYLDTASGTVNQLTGVAPATAAQLADPEFFRTLGWSEDIWDLSTLTTHGYPTLVFAPQETAELGALIQEAPLPES